MRIENSKGFGYIEIMAVIVIVSILVRIALFAYEDNIIETRRMSMQLQLMDIRELIMQKQQANGKLGDYEAAYSIISEVSNPYYTLSSYPTNLAKSNKKLGGFDTAIVATPIVGTSQAGDGVICLTKSGYRYWEYQAKECRFSESMGFGFNQTNPFKTMAEVRGATWYGD